MENKEFTLEEIKSLYRLLERLKTREQINAVSFYLSIKERLFNAIYIAKQMGISDEEIMELDKEVLKQVETEFGMTEEEKFIEYFTTIIPDNPQNN